MCRLCLTVLVGSLMCLQSPFLKLMTTMPSSSIVASVIRGSVKFSSIARNARVLEIVSFLSSSNSIFIFSFDIKLCVLPDANSTSIISKLFSSNPNSSASSGLRTITGSSLSAPPLTKTINVFALFFHVTLIHSSFLLVQPIITP